MRILSLPIMETFDLVSDPDGKAQVTIRQAREGENIERNEMFARTTRIYNDDQIGEIKLQQEYNQRKLRRKEAYLTLGRFTGVEDENAKELFSFAETKDGPSIKVAMDESQFNSAWGKLPPEAAAEVSRLVYQVNPTWDPTRQGE